MNKPISFILWPPNRKDAVRLLVEYMVRTLEELGITYPLAEHDPIFLAVVSISDGVSREKRDAELSYWWSIVDSLGVQNFTDNAALMARIAICLLSAREDDSLDLGDQLSWFIEVVGFLEKNVFIAVELMERHFDFRKQRPE